MATPRSATTHMQDREVRFWPPHALLEWAQQTDKLRQHGGDCGFWANCLDSRRVVMETLATEPPGTTAMAAALLARDARGQLQAIVAVRPELRYRAELIWGAVCEAYELVSGQTDLPLELTA